MKHLRRSKVNIAASIFVAMATLALTTSACFATCDPIASDEQGTLTGHLVGDTVARGIDLAIKPIHQALSRAFFFVSKPCELEPTTTIRVQDPPANK